MFCTGFGIAAVEASGQPRLLRVQDTPRNQQGQTESQTPEQNQNSSEQAGPEKEPGRAETGSEASQPPGSEQEDAGMAVIEAALKDVSTPDLSVLGQIFKTTVRKQDDPPNESSPTDLVNLGDLDGDGVSEIALKLSVPEASEKDTEGQESSPPLQGLYLLSWDGTHWKASRLVAPVESYQLKVVRLGKKTGSGIAVVSLVGEEAAPYPAIFGLREHAAALLWDSQAGNNLYNALEHGQIEFREDAKLDQTELIETGRADPGLLQCEPGGHRGFNVRYVYHWDGQSYVPIQTEYAASPDYTLYRFIAALHLRDFRSAYTLVDPGQFLKTNAPSLEKFRRMIEETWPEFLDDQVFQAREASAGSPEALAFELPEKHYVYRPTLSADGRFLLTNLERKVEIPDASSNGD